MSQGEPNGPPELGRWLITHHDRNGQLLAHVTFRNEDIDSFELLSDKWAVTIDEELKKRDWKLGGGQTPDGVYFDGVVIVNPGTPLGLIMLADRLALHGLCLFQDDGIARRVIEEDADNDVFSRLVRRVIRRGSPRDP